jgi:hypothetical protein
MTLIIEPLRTIDRHIRMNNRRNLKPKQASKQKPLRVRYSELLRLRKIVREAEIVRLNPRTLTG